MAELLVSVRSVEEAADALAGGAAVIDVKEPQLGSLGRADEEVIAEVVRFVAGRRPVSAALGELLDDVPPLSRPGLFLGLTFVKWGLARCGKMPDWPTLLQSRQASILLADTCHFVHVAYADWQCAQAPPLQEVVDLACAAAGGVLLLDTCCKTSSAVGRAAPTLLEWLSVAETMEIGRRCRAAGVRLALAGSLGPAEIGLLLPAQPTWFAVRGAVCEGGREGLVRECRVRNLVKMIKK